MDTYGRYVLLVVAGTHVCTGAGGGSSYRDMYVKDDVKIRVMTCVRTCSDGAVPDVVVCVTVVRTRMLADEGSSDRCVMCTGME